MSYAAFLWRDISLHWAGLFAALGVLSAALALGSLQLAGGRSLKPLGLFLPAAILFSLIFARFFHWYSFPLQYGSFAAAMTDYRTGGFVLAGAFPGVLLAAGLLRLCGFTDDFPAFLDALAPAGALGIAVGRLGAAFDGSCRGSFLPHAPWLQRPPFAAPLFNADGTVTWRFATYAWQAAAAALLFLLCLVLFFRLRREKKGHVFLLFMNFYAAAQIVLDSTRYDAAFLRSNGFIHVPQLCCVAVLAGVCIFYSAAWLSQPGFSPRLGILWGGFLALGGLGGYMEYFVQRHGDRFALAYPVMTAGFFLMALINVYLFRQSGNSCAPGNSSQNAK